VTDGTRLQVFDVQRFCVHDGPGIRTTVFLKGCPLRCRWCQNPESQHSKTELAFVVQRCTGCGRCVDACPHRAVRSGAPPAEGGACRACGACVEACPHEARRLVGRSATVGELMDDVLADRRYMGDSGGGLTLSGGEPLVQPRGAAALLQAAQAAGLNTLVETAGDVPWRHFERVLPHTDRFYFDLKAPDDRRHQEWTGRSSANLLNNARKLLEAGADVAFRMPVVPGFTDAPGVLEGIADLLRSLDRPALRVLPYHRLGEDKLAWLGSGQAPLGVTGREGEEAFVQAAVHLARLGVGVVKEGRRRAPEPERTFPERVWRLREAVQSAPPSVCTERAVSVTRYTRRRVNRRKPAVIQRAEALAAVLAERSVQVHEDELLVGNFSSHRVGGAIFPELHGVAQCEDLLSYRGRKVNPLRIRWRDVLTLGLQVLPFWLPRFLSMRAFPPLRALRFVADQLTAKRYVINETGGISHFVPDYEVLLAAGTDALADNARRRLSESEDPRKRDFYEAAAIACDALGAFGDRCATEARYRATGTSDPERREELVAVAGVCSRVPRGPAKTLQEALQSLLLAQIALNAESLDNSVSPGRLDQILLPYYRADVEAGRLDEAGARELIGCFVVKMSEIVPVFSRRITRIHGGMFNGQVVAVGGVDRDGEDATNELTWLFLDAVDQLRMRQPNFHLRVHGGSPPELLERAADMLRRGSGAPSLMNDDSVVPMLTGRGTAEEDARDYSPVGCVEPVACASTFGSTDAALVNLALPLEWALGVRDGGAELPPLSSCEGLDDVVDRLRVQIDHLVDLVMGDLQAVERANARFHPTPLTSMLVRGCLESGMDASAGGARYNGSGVQGVGVADLADSLAAVDEVVFRRKECDLDTLRTALQADFRGHEALRGYLSRAPKYGNDHRGVDELADRVMGLFADSLARHTSTRGGDYFAGFYSVTVHEAFGEHTGALPSGRRAGAPLANGLSPGTGLDRLGPTAALNSTARLDVVRRARNGINVNIKLDQGLMAGDEGLGNLVGLLRGYFTQGGMQLQVNAVDAALLRAAMADPDAHPWLLVRVSGYSAYFQDLSPGMQRELIERTCHGG